MASPSKEVLVEKIYCLNLMHLLGYDGDGVSVASVVDVYTLDIYDELSLCVLQLMYPHPSCYGFNWCFKRIFV